MWLETDNSLVNLDRACAIERRMNDENQPYLLIHFPSGQARRRTITDRDEMDETSSRLELVEGLIKSESLTQNPRSDGSPLSVKAQRGVSDVLSKVQTLTDLRFCLSLFCGCRRHPARHYDL